MLDRWRAQNTSILLSKFRCSLATIREAVIKLDPAVLSPDDVQMLKLYIPTDEEAALLRSYEGPPSSLGIAERFFLEILEVPRYRERLCCFEYLQAFDDKDAEVTHNLEVLAACCDELQVWGLG
jgi:hypothetical protein